MLDYELGKTITNVNVVDIKSGIQLVCPKIWFRCDIITQFRKFQSHVFIWEFSI